MSNSYAVGDRVRLRGPIQCITLTSDRGTLVRQDDDLGHWIVRLDQPADYVDAGTGDTRHLNEVVEHAENLELETP